MTAAEARINALGLARCRRVIQARLGFAGHPDLVTPADEALADEEVACAAYRRLTGLRTQDRLAGEGDPAADLDKNGKRYAVHRRDGRVAPQAVRRGRGT